MDKEFLTLTEIAHLLHCSRTTVYRIIQRANITPLYQPAHPRTPLFRREDIQRLTMPTQKEPINNQTLHRKIKQKYNNRCVICGSTHLVAAHHIIPIEQGGHDDESNLITLCRGCHCSLHGKGKAILVKARKNGTLAIAIWLRKAAGFSV
jgi:5-methylcytosine-specific restriction endonuclease McrA